MLHLTQMDASDPAAEALSQAEFARRLGVTRQYVNQLVKRKVIALKDGRIDFAEAVRAIEAAQDPARPRTRPELAPLPATMSYQAARTLKEEYAALHRKLEYEQACGKLLPVDQVVQAWQQLVAAFRAKCLSLPSRLAPMLAMSERGEIHKALTAAVREALEELSRFDLPRDRPGREPAGSNGKFRRARATPVH